MPNNKTLRAIVRLITWSCVSYAGAYPLLTHIARIGYGEYDGAEFFVRVPTWGRMWDLTPIFALAVVGLLWGYLMSRGED